MPGVPTRFAEHSMKVDVNAKPIKQKLCRFANDCKEAIGVSLQNYELSVL
jgi:hypothetical protein